MRAGSVVHLVGTRCNRPELEEEWNKWYDEVHVPTYLTIKGLLGVAYLV